MINSNETAVTGNWIKLSRSILDWEWYSEPNTFRVFVDLLLNAQYKDSRYRGNEIKRGQLITSQDAICKRTGLSRQNVRTALANLQSTGEINQQTNQHFTLITICKYDTYQGESEEGNQPTNQQVTNNQPTSNHIQEGKNIRNKEFSTTTTGENFVQEENAFEEIPSEEAKDYFSLKQVFDRLYSLYKEESFDENAKNFIKTKFFMIRSKAFTKKSGEIWDVISFTNWLAKLLSEEGYQLSTPVFDITKAKTFSPAQNVIPPFTKDDVRNCLKNENDEVINELLTKYDDFARNGFKTKSGNAVTLSFMTGFLKDEVKKSLGIKDNGLPDYSKLNVAKFWD